jgi:putative tryptophan/tyrosine transport system substrate-binding protein
MKRRALLGAMAMLPSLARAQAPARPVIGFLAAGTPDPREFLGVFKTALRGLGHVDGETLRLEVRSVGSTDPARLQAAARELVALKPRVIATYQTPPTEAAKEVTHDVPIVMAGVGDPVGTGLVASLARPGGNITGVSSATSEVSAKNVDLLRELLPHAKAYGVLVNANDPFSKPFLASIQSAGAGTRIEIRPVLAKGAPGVDAGFAELVTSGVDAFILQPSLGLVRSAELGLKHKLPGACPNPNFARAGGLLAYSANQVSVARSAAHFIDRLLKGAKPADLPVEQPTEFDLTLNLKTAKLLGVTPPQTILIRASEVIE